MTEANKDEADKCKQIALSALSAGDTDKATRFLQKAKRMCPSDASIDELLAKAASGPDGAAGSNFAGGGGGASTSQEGMRHRATPAPADHGSASGPARASATRTGKDGGSYTPDQMQMVQKILRTKDYYDVIGVPRDADADAVKRAYKKLALKLHPDKNKAPGAEEAFKKLSKAVQCLTDEEKKHVYDQYGDEERMPQRHRHQYQQDFMSPEDLFAAFFGAPQGGGFHSTFHHRGGGGGGGDAGGEGQNPRLQIFQMLPILVILLFTLASNFASREGGARFSFTANAQYTNERQTATLGVNYYVTDSFEEHYAEGTKALAEFELQVDIYYVRNLHSDCDYQEKTMYKKVMIARRRGNQEEVQAARSHPRPACKEIDRIKRKHIHIYRQAVQMGIY